MTNILRDQSEIRGVQRAPEVFMVLDSLFRPAPVHEPNLPELKVPVQPYLPAEIVQAKPVEAGEIEASPGSDTQ